MVAPQLVEELDAALEPDVHVEEDDGRRLGAQLTARLLEGRGLVHAPALQLEVDPAEKPDRGVVVHDEDVLGGPPLHLRPRVYPRTPNKSQVVYLLKMRNGERSAHPRTDTRRDPPEWPRPTPHFRRRACLEFQRALDPLAPPKQLRLPPLQH